MAAEALIVAVSILALRRHPATGSGRSWRPLVAGALVLVAGLAWSGAAVGSTGGDMASMPIWVTFPDIPSCPAT